MLPFPTPIRSMNAIYTLQDLFNCKHRRLLFR